jgi:hypothetical protein
MIAPTVSKARKQIDLRLLRWTKDEIQVFPPSINFFEN